MRQTISIIAIPHAHGASKKAAARPQSARASDLGRVLSSAGITKVILIRHANAQPCDPEAAAVEAGTVLKPDYCGMGCGLRAPRRRGGSGADGSYRMEPTAELPKTRIPAIIDANFGQCVRYQ